MYARHALRCWLLFLGVASCGCGKPTAGSGTETTLATNTGTGPAQPIPGGQPDDNNPCEKDRQTLTTLAERHSGLIAPASALITAGGDLKPSSGSYLFFKSDYEGPSDAQLSEIAKG